MVRRTCTDRRQHRRCLIAQVCLLALARPQIAEAAEPQQEPSTQLVHPKLTNEVSLSYPRELLDQTPRPEGQVVVKYVVGVDGVPKEIEVTTPVHPTLDALAIAAVADLRYTPATYGGQPVEVVLSIGIEIAVPAPEPETEPEPEAEPANGEEPSQVEDTGPVRLAGMLLEAGRRTPVVGAVILAVPAEGDPPVGKIRRKRYGAEQTSPAWSVRAVSDETGGFELRGLPAGKVRFVVLTQGFERLEFIEEITATARVEVTYFQERLVANPYRTVVASKRDEPEEVTRRTISVEEINNLPGTQGDALKSIQNFPGIARAPLGIGLLVIRGSAPSDSNTYLGYHKIPQLFHFGALSSVFNSDMLAQIDFIPGNFDSRFGDSIGGVVNVVPRKGRRDGFHGYIDADVFDVGALVEGPVGEGSYALSARRSYIDAVLGVALPEDIGLGFVQAPRYWDYQGLFDYPLGGGELSLRAFGSDDQVSLVTEDANESATDERNEFGTRILFHRADIVYRKQEGPWDFLITPSYRYQEANGGALGIFEFSLIQHEFSGRAEFGYRMSRRAALRVGTEVGAGTSIIDARAPSFPAGSGLGSTGVENVGRIEHPYANPAIYATASIGLGDRFVLYPGARLRYNAITINRAAFDPRLRFSWQVADRTQLKGGVGQFSQTPEITQFNDVWGNPNLGIERSLHTSFGVAQELDYGVDVEVTGFYKYVWDRVTSSDNLVVRDDRLWVENFANQGTGHIYGAELLVRKALTRRLFGWLSYTYIRSLVRQQPGRSLTPFDFDQPHILTLLAVYKLPRNWQIGGRFRLVSGNPNTPRTSGVFNAESGEYLPLDGERNSERLPAFHQLDVRVDKRWVLRRALITGYLDIQNLYNRQNIEAWNYSYNFRQRVGTAGLPIIPSLGMRIAW